RGDPCFVETEIVRVRPPANGEQEMGADDLRLCSRMLYGHLDVVTLFCHLDDLAIQSDINVFVLEDIRDGARDILVLASDEIRRKLDHRDVTSESAIGLRELESDIAPAENDEVGRQKIYLHHRAVGQVGDLVQPTDRRHDRPAAHIDKNLIGGETFTVDLYRLGPDETTMALENGTSFKPLQRSLDAFARGKENRVLTRFNSLHVHTNRAADGHAIIVSATREIRGIGARDQSLGRGTAGIDAGTTEELALDYGN